MIEQRENRICTYVHTYVRTTYVCPLWRESRETEIITICVSTYKALVFCMYYYAYPCIILIFFLLWQSYYVRTARVVLSRGSSYVLSLSTRHTSGSWRSWTRHAVHSFVRSSALLFSAFNTANYHVLTSSVCLSVCPYSTQDYEMKVVVTSRYWLTAARIIMRWSFVVYTRRTWFSLAAKIVASWQ